MTTYGNKISRDTSKNSLISLSQLKPLCFFTEQKKLVSGDPVKRTFGVKKAKYKSFINTKIIIKKIKNKSRFYLNNIDLFIS